jgi:hypothetical protein
MSGPSPASPSSTTPLLSSLPEPLNKPPPRLTTWLLTGPDGHGRSIKSSPVIIEPAREADCLGVMKDGFGRVRKGKVGGDWLWVEGEGRKMTQGAGRADEPAKQGERVILYFVGGELLYAYFLEDIHRLTDRSFIPLLQEVTCKPIFPLLLSTSSLFSLDPYLLLARAAQEPRSSVRNATRSSAPPNIPSRLDSSPSPIVSPSLMIKLSLPLSKTPSPPTLI